MEQRTLEHLARADHHREVARALIGPLAPQISTEPPFDWAVVAAFYAAVHYVNAYLWETRGYTPGSHPDRGAAVRAEPATRGAGRAYRNLQDLGYQGRYASDFRPTPEVLRHAVEHDLEAVRRVVRQSLGLPA